MESITFDDLTRIALVIMALWGFYKVITEIVKAITAKHDKEKGWDDTAKEMVRQREEIVKKYDERLEGLEGKIEENHCDTEAKIQEVRAELLILTECMRAVLDGLHQQGCNGKVTEASEKLDEYLTVRAHE